MDESLFENDEQTDDVEDPLAIPSLAQTVEESESGRRVSVDTPSGSFADEDSNPYPALRDQSQGEGGGDAHDKFLGYSMYDQLPRSGDQAFHVKRPKCGGRGKMFKCSNCTKAYPIKASLKRHLRSGLCVLAARKCKLSSAGRVASRLPGNSCVMFTSGCTAASR